MNFILIFGPSAVGKMTVGKALAEKTGYKLFHNHVSLELANRFFDFGTDSFEKIDRLVRFGVFNIVAESDLEGFIFTLCWALDLSSDAEYVERIVNTFKTKGAQIHYVELAAAQNIRLKRNHHPDRLAEKASKRDVVQSEKWLLASDEKYRQNTRSGEMPERRILKINNADLTPAEVADRIVAHYGW